MKSFCRKISMPLARFSIFIVYFWFGVLKVLGHSPANQMVSELLAKTMPGVAFSSFIIFFGIFEMLIGVLFIIPRFNKVALVLLTAHLVAIMSPLFILPHLTLNGFLIPTLEGQYIIKNILIIALAVVIFSYSHKQYNA